MTSDESDQVIRVLLVEDDENEETLLDIELKRRGLTCEFSRVDSEAALRNALLIGRWDVVVSDHSMPGFDGMRACGMARRLRPDVPFIFVSGSLEEDRAIEAMRAGARDFISKGGHYTHVAQAIRREIDVARESGISASRVDLERLYRRALEEVGACLFECTVLGNPDAPREIQCAWRCRDSRLSGIADSLTDKSTSFAAWRTWATRHVKAEDISSLVNMWRGLVATRDSGAWSGSVRLQDDAPWIPLRMVIRVVGRAPEVERLILTGVVYL